MRILIFGDLHANLEALRAWQAVEPQPDVVLFLGDVVGYGPDAGACLTWIRRHADCAVRGDHDEGAATQATQHPAWHDAELAAATLAHARRILTQDELRYLGALPLEARLNLNDARFYLAHAAPRAQLGPGLDLLMTSERRLQAELEGLDADVVLVGHTHVPSIRRVGRTYIVNPGSLGQPRHGTPSATYAVWQDGDLAIRHVDYDYATTQRKLALLPLDPEDVTKLQGILQKGM